MKQDGLKLSVLVVLFALGAFAQKAKNEKYDTSLSATAVKVEEGTSGTWVKAATSTPANVETRITKDGHYIFSLDDPNNTWRCYFNSVGNGGLVVDTITVTCVNAKKLEKSQVRDERESAARERGER
jgi:hypothetical protein